MKLECFATPADYLIGNKQEGVLADRKEHDGLAIYVSFRFDSNNPIIKL